MQASKSACKSQKNVVHLQKFLLLTTTLTTFRGETTQPRGKGTKYEEKTYSFIIPFYFYCLQSTISR